MSSEPKPAVRQSEASPPKTASIPTGIYWAVVSSFLAFPMGIIAATAVAGEFQLNNLFEGLGISFLLVLPLLLCGGIIPIAAVGILAAVLTRRICGPNSKRWTMCCAALAFTGDLIFVVVLQWSGFLESLFYIP